MFSLETHLWFWEGLLQRFLPTDSTGEITPSSLLYVPYTYVSGFCILKYHPTIYKHNPSSQRCNPNCWVVLWRVPSGNWDADNWANLVLQNAHMDKCLMAYNEKYPFTLLRLVLGHPRVLMECSLPVFQCWCQTRYLFCMGQVAPKRYRTLPSVYTRG